MTDGGGGQPGFALRDSRLTRWVASWAAIDLRSLAAVRIALASCVLADLGLRSTDLTSLYSDHGLLPRADLLLEWPTAFATTPSLLFAGGDFAFLLLFFTVAALASVSLLVGYRSRTCAALVWFFVTSIHLRNPQVLYGVDPLLRLVPLWLALLPCGAVWSFDSVLAGSKRRSPPPWLSVAGIGLIVQIFVVYFIAGVAKMADASWMQGHGFGQVLDYVLLVRPAGQWLHDHVALSTAANWFVIALELVAPFTLFAPLRWWRVRVFTVVLLATMHVGIFATMTVGFFTVVPVACILVAIPGAFWDRFSRIKAVEPSAPVRFPERSWLPTEGLAALMLVWTVVWNIGLWSDADYKVPSPLVHVGDTLALDQKWGMFTQLGATGTFDVPGTLDDGTTIDLLAAGGPLPSLAQARAGRGPASTPALEFKNIYWRIVYVALSERPNDSPRFSALGRYYCREFNNDRPEGRSLERVEIIFKARTPSADPDDRVRRQIESLALWNHDCFG
ncbi:MAG: hypothetical protein ACI8TX_000861 [Hyphomicrobiaceae bacterium]